MPLNIRLLYRAQQERRLGLTEKPMSEAAFSQPGDAVCNSTSAPGDSQERVCVAEDTGSSNSGQGVEETVNSAQRVGDSSSREKDPVDPKGELPSSLLSCRRA
jgi:hypothetical protein